MKYIVKSNILFIILILLSLQQSISQEDNTKYADVLVEAYYSNANYKFQDFYGGSLGNFPVPIRPNIILGANTNYFLSLPKGSYVIVGFRDNEIIDYPNQDDIIIVENGCNHEQAEIFVSSDGKEFTRLGIVNDCDKNSLDLQTINYTKPVRFIKIVGLDNKGGSPGFDVVSISGLPNSNIAYNINHEIDSIAKYLLKNYEPTNNPDTLLFVVPDILFKKNNSELLFNSELLLNNIAKILTANKNLKIRLIESSNNKNKILKKQRVVAVRKYLLTKGVVQNKIIDKDNNNKVARKH